MKVLQQIVVVARSFVSQFANRRVRLFVLAAALMLPFVMLWQFYRVTAVGNEAASAQTAQPQSRLEPARSAGLEYPPRTQIGLEIAYASPDQRNTSSIAWGDLDGDGDLDYVVGNRGETDQIFENQANEGRPFTFASHVLATDVITTSSLALGDMDGDGDLDIAIGNESGRNQIFENLGALQFSEAVSATERFPADQTRSIAWGDMDGDGDLDLVVGNGNQNRPGDAVNWVYENKVDQDNNQLFEAHSISSESLDTASIALGDLNNDGKVDIVIANKGQQNAIYLNRTANAMFRFEKSLFDTSESDSTGVALGDFDRDGNLDIAVANSNSPSRVFANAGGATPVFVLITETVTMSSRSVAWGDLNGDGDLDLAIGNENAANYLYRNDNGTFVAHRLDNDAHSALSVSWADVDGDGDLDLAFGNELTPSEIAVCGRPGDASCFLNGGNLIYQNHGTQVLVATTLGGKTQLDMGEVTTSPIWSQDIAWGDYNNDGCVDLALAIYQSINVVYENQKDEHCLGQFKNVSETVGSASRAITWLDIDGDGDLDLAIGNGDLERNIADGRNNQLFKNLHIENRESGAADAALFVEVKGAAFTEHVSATESLAPGDVNGDGRIDLVAGNLSGNDIVYLNQTTSRAEHPEFKAVALPDSFFSTRGLALSDMDNDGDLDIAVAYYDNRPNRVYENHGNGEFEPHDIGNLTSNSWDVDWGDADGDGDLDIAVANTGVNHLYRNDGNGVFTTFQLGSDAHASRRIEWGDVDNDGDLDIAVANGEFFELVQSNQIYINDGNAAFHTIQAGNFVSRTRGLSWGDVDNDGDLDLVTANLAPINDDSTNHSNQLYRNYLNETGVLNGSPILLSVQHPISTPVAVGLVPNDVLDTEQIPIQFTFPNVVSGFVGYVEGEYSLNGGGQWFPAVAATGTQTVNLRTEIQQTYVYTWDTFASGFFGRSDNVVFRITAYPQAPAGVSVVGSTFRYTNTTPGLIQRPYVRAVSHPFRVQGTQVRVVSSDSNHPNKQGAYVYRKEKDAFSAMIMGDYTAGEAFITDQNGYLNGRGVLAKGDGLFATLPMIQTYRTPPQIILPDEDSEFAIAATESLAGSDFTVEFWVAPTSDSGELFTWGSDLVLSFTRSTMSLDSSATFTMRSGLATETATPHLSFVDSLMHHVAFAWSDSESEGVMYVDGMAVLTTTAPMPMAFEAGDFAGFGRNMSGNFDEMRLWQTRRSPNELAESRDQYNQAARISWPTPFGSKAGVIPTTTVGLRHYWPIIESDTEEIDGLMKNQLRGYVHEAGSIVFKPLYTVYHTNGAVTDTLGFQQVEGGGVQTVTVSAEHPLILFDLEVSLEWDPRGDPDFLLELQQSFNRASELLYDVTNGQAALRQVNFFYNKAFWGQADIVIHASNSLRPSAAIGGHVNRPRPDTILKSGVMTVEENAYLPGQIRMGTVWEPFGENSSELGEEWSRALAHELAHYLFFLPDNYLGFGEEPDNNVLRLIDCRNSFMTNNIDPVYSEFLPREMWDDRCLQTIAERTTGRSDWETIQKFYPMLHSPKGRSLADYLGPEVIPFNLLELFQFNFGAQQNLLPPRNFVIRQEGSNERRRLPSAQVFLIKRQNTPENWSDDQLIRLGTPTGGGDRIKVRGAANGDILCLLNAQEIRLQPSERYAACTTLDETDAVIHVNEVPAWTPQVEISSQDGRKIDISITLDESLERTESLYIQLFPQHYMALNTLAPHHVFELNGKTILTTQIELPLPAFELAVRIWISSNGGTAESNGQDPLLSTEGLNNIFTVRLNPPEWRPFAVPLTMTAQISTAANSNTPLVPITGNPVLMPTGGPVLMPTGGPVLMPTGGPVMMPADAPIQSPDSSRRITPYAPILSADAQVAIYNAEGFFEDNGVVNLQEKSGFPNLASWLVPVGEAYLVESVEDFPDDRFISFSYLQRNVPEGYEDTLAIYFCPIDVCDEGQWQRLDDEADTHHFVENMLVAPLQSKDGIYAVMASISMPGLLPGWNLFAYPLPVSRSVTDTLASISGTWTLSNVFTIGTINSGLRSIVWPAKGVSSLNLRAGPGTEHEIVGALKRHEGAIVVANPNPTIGWHEIDCKRFAEARNTCFVTSAPQLADTFSGYNTPGELSPLTVRSSNPDMLLPNHVYWVYLDADKVQPFFIAPPVQRPDGVLDSP